MTVRMMVLLLMPLMPLMLLLIRLLVPLLLWTYQMHPMIVLFWMLLLLWMMARLLMSLAPMLLWMLYCFGCCYCIKITPLSLMLLLCTSNAVTKTSALV